MKTVPQVRVELLAIAKQLKADAVSPSNSPTSDPRHVSRQIVRLVNSLKRRKAVRRAPIEHAKLTPELKARIKQYASSHHSASYASMGLRFNVAISGISTAIAGKRAA